MSLEYEPIQKSMSLEYDSNSRRTLAPLSAIFSRATRWSPPLRCRARCMYKTVNIRQSRPDFDIRRSRPDFGLVFRVKVLETVQDVPSALGSGCISSARRTLAPLTATFSGAIRWSVYPSPFTFHPTPYALHPSPFTLHPTPYTLHPDRAQHPGCSLPSRMVPWSQLVLEGRARPGGRDLPPNPPMGVGTVC